jgi:hypothetical protein
VNNNIRNALYNYTIIYLDQLAEIEAQDTQTLKENIECGGGLICKYFFSNY